MDRYRTRGSLTLNQPAYERSSQGGSSGPYYGTKCGMLTDMWDTVTPQFRRLRALGQVVFNNMTKAELMWNPDSGYGYSYRNSGGVTYSVSEPMLNINAKTYIGYTVQNTPLVYRLYTDTELASMISEACTGVLAKRGRSDANSWENIAELHKTLELVKSPIASWWRFSRKNKIASLTSSAANAYLIWRYGIRPLIKDVSAIIEQIPQANRTVRQTVRESVSDTRSALSSVTYTAGPMTTSVGIQKTHTVAIRAVSLDEFYLSVPIALGLSSKALLTLPWELISYSFVADWFANVGDYFASICPSPEYKQLGSCYTIDQKIEATYSFLDTTISSGNTLLRKPFGSFSGYERYKSRLPLAASKLVVRNDFGFSRDTRVADALALVWQQASRFFMK